MRRGPTLTRGAATPLRRAATPPRRVATLPRRVATSPRGAARPPKARPHPPTRRGPMRGGPMRRGHTRLGGGRTAPNPRPSPSVIMACRLSRVHFHDRVILSIHTMERAARSPSAGGRGGFLGRTPVIMRRSRLPGGTTRPLFTPTRAFPPDLPRSATTVAVKSRRRWRTGSWGGSGLVLPCPAGAISMITTTYPHKLTVSRPDCHSLRVRKRG